MDRSREQSINFIRSQDATATPSLKDLHEHVTPQYASEWKGLGTLLDIPYKELQIIEVDYPNSVKRCYEMLSKWTETRHATWEKLCHAIESPAMYNDQDKFTSQFKFTIKEGTDAVNKLSENLHKRYREKYFGTAEGMWPPHQPKVFIPLQIIYHNDWYTKKERRGVVTFDFIDHLATLEKCEDQRFMLIEGAPGMGKSMLMKEIAYRWGRRQLLQKYKLVLLVRLGDPAVQKASNLNDLLQFSNTYMTAREITACSDHLLNNNDGGKHIMFLFDGLDELPVAQMESSFIADIIQRRVLPNSGLIVSSRPHVSVCLREQAIIRIIIKGFSKTDQTQFIQQAMRKHPHMITQFLENTCNLCFIPFFMVALFYLYKKGVSLSENSYELYNKLICLTICRHHAKQSQCFEKEITNLIDLPDPYNVFIQQLSKLSAKALCKNQSEFTFDEVKAACPHISNIAGAINGFGILQAVQEFGVTAKTMTFKFMHSCIQEFLAKHYIRSFSFSEVDNKDIFRSLSLRCIKLSSSDVNCVTVFLTQSPHQEWEELDLHGCEIEDHGIHILHQGLTKHNITITRLSLSNNKLTESSSPMIRDIAISCKVKVLAVRLNPHIGKDPKLYEILSDPNSMVEELYINHTNDKQSSTATELFTALGESKKIKAMWISSNNITNEDCDSIVMALKKNTSLEKLDISHNTLNKDSALRIVKTLEYYRTLQNLVLPWYPLEEQEEITSLAREVDKMTAQDCRLKLSFRER